MQGWCPALASKLAGGRPGPRVCSRGRGPGASQQPLGGATGHSAGREARRGSHRACLPFLPRSFARPRSRCLGAHRCGPAPVSPRGRRRPSPQRSAGNRTPGRGRHPSAPKAQGSPAKRQDAHLDALDAELRRPSATAARQHLRPQRRPAPAAPLPQRPAPPCPRRDTPWTRPQTGIFRLDAPVEWFSRCPSRTCFRKALGGWGSALHPANQISAPRVGPRSSLPLRNSSQDKLSIKGASIPGEVGWAGNKRASGRHWTRRVPITMETRPAVYAAATGAILWQ